MLVKNILIDVDVNTWPRKSEVPSWLSGASGLQTIDLAQALLMFGSLTTPNIYSIASPARFWAWMRYYFAVAGTPDFRITRPFADLDPHQKSVLSDDFGVAISTQWLFDRLGSFAEISDGGGLCCNFLARLAGRDLPRLK
jgi:hypothetical protein